MPARSRKQQTGFSLLEAIVAIAVVGVSGGALFGWVNTVMVTLSRVEAHAERQYVTQQAVAVIEIINPMIEPAGHWDMGDYDMQWQATAVEPPKDSVNRYGLPGLYQVGLYEVTVELTRDGKPLSSFVTRQVGYKQVRQRES